MSFCFPHCRRVDILQGCPPHHHSDQTLVHILPRGAQVLVWLTLNEHSQPIAVVQWTHSKQQQTFATSFRQSLAFGRGAVFSGVYAQEALSKVHCVLLHNVHWLYEEQVDGWTWKRKHAMLEELFASGQLGQSVVNRRHGLLLGLPTTQLQQQYSPLVPYEVQIRLAEDTQREYRMSILEWEQWQVRLQKKRTVKRRMHSSSVYRDCRHFYVRASRKADLYELFDDREMQVYVGHALIPTYETSCWMNSLFRNIKENERLDALEESDDEVEFESEHPETTLWIKADVVKGMWCEWHPVCQKWVPKALNE